MDVQLHQAGIDLDVGRFLTLRRAKGTRVLCLAGQLWITQDRDTHDHFVQPGGTFEMAVDGAVVIQAQQPSRLLLLEPRTPARSRWPGRWIGQSFGPTAGRWFERSFGTTSLNGKPPAVALLHGA